MSAAHRKIRSIAALLLVLLADGCVQTCGPGLPACHPGKFCNARDSVCQVPGASCTVAGDCESLEICNSGLCASAPHCDATTSCLLPLLCNQARGLCQRPSLGCDTDTDCATGETCVGAQCCGPTGCNASSEPPAIVAISGDGPAGEVRTGLIIAGQGLSDGLAKIQFASAGIVILSTTDSSDTRLSVAFSAPIQPGTGTLLVTTALGSVSADVALLQGDPGSTGPPGFDGPAGPDGPPIDPASLIANGSALQDAGFSLSGTAMAAVLQVLGGRPISAAGLHCGDGAATRGGIINSFDGGSGYRAAKAICEQACGNALAHLCTGSEIARSLQAGWSAPDAGLWYSAPVNGDCDGFECGLSARQSCATATGSIAQAGSPRFGSAVCNEAHGVACCL